MSRQETSTWVRAGLLPFVAEAGVFASNMAALERVPPGDVLPGCWTSSGVVEEPGEAVVPAVEADLHEVAMHLELDAPMLDASRGAWLDWCTELFRRRCAR